MEKKILKQNKKFNKELNLAKRMQYSLLPTTLEYNNIEVEYFYKPCDKIGGDLFNIYRIDENNLGIYISDVSGHGVPAALVTMFLSQTIDNNEKSPSKILSKLYKNYKKLEFENEMYITIFMAVINIREKILKYSNAGHHLLPIVFNSDKANPLYQKGLPISNWFETNEYTYNEGTYRICEKDKILFATDGLIELTNSENKEYGIDNLYKFISKHKSSSILDFKNELVTELNNFSDLETFDDDITFLILKT